MNSKEWERQLPAARTVNEQLEAFSVGPYVQAGPTRFRVGEGR